MGVERRHDGRKSMKKVNLVNAGSLIGGSRDQAIIRAQISYVGKHSPRDSHCSGGMELTRKMPAGGPPAILLLPFW